MKKILVIEDEQPLLEEIVDTLGFSGYEVMEAPDGQAGVQLARERLPDLIISDITMPIMDGYAVLLALREKPETACIPFIFLTARSDRSFVRHGMELGADDYLTKPFTHHELVAAIDARFQRLEEVAVGSAQELAQAKKTLLQMVSHELRTPLVSMTMVQDLIERQLGQLSPEKLQELFEALHRSGHRLRHLVEQIVFLTQVEAGALSKETILEHGSPAQSWAVLIGAVQLAREFVYRNRDAVVQRDERDSQATIQCLMPALKHALAELIANALNFSPDGGAIVVAQWTAHDRVWISITDQGPGMSEDQLKLARRDFQQVDRERREQQGLGLGLPIARRIIELHGGSLKISSAPDKGTQVVVQLPLYTDTTEIEPPNQ